MNENLENKTSTPSLKIINFFYSKVKEIKTTWRNIPTKFIKVVIFLFIFGIELYIYWAYSILFLFYFLYYLFKNIIIIFLFKKTQTISLSMKLEFNPVRYIIFLFTEYPNKISLLVIYNFLTKKKITKNEIKLFFAMFVLRRILGFPIWIIEAAVNLTFMVLKPFYDVNWKNKNKIRWVIIYYESFCNFFYIINRWKYNQLNNILDSKRILVENKIIKINGKIDRNASELLYALYKQNSIPPIKIFKEKVNFIPHMFFGIGYESKNNWNVGKTLTSQTTTPINNRQLAILNENEWNGQYSVAGIYKNAHLKLVEYYKMSSVQRLSQQLKMVKFAIDMRDNEQFPLLKQWDGGKKQIVSYWEIKKDLDPSCGKFIDEETYLFEEEILRLAIITLPDMYRDESIKKMLNLDYSEIKEYLSEAAEINADKLLMADLKKDSIL